MTDRKRTIEVLGRRLPTVAAPGRTGETCRLPGSAMDLLEMNGMDVQQRAAGLGQTNT